jgi:iron complex outermembrane receptor protein
LGVLAVTVTARPARAGDTAVTTPPQDVAVASASDSTSTSDSATAVSSITVTAQGEKSQVTRVVSSGVLGNQTVLTTPFSVEAVTSDEIENLQTKDINGVFRDDASIQEINSSLAQASGAAFRIRGVALDQLNSYKLDGLTIPYWSIDLPIEDFDQVQLFKGATGFMYGFGSPGGIVNFVTKRPTDQTLNFDFGYRSDSLFGGHGDIGGRFDNDRFGLRVNAEGEDGTVYNGGKNYNYSFDVAADARLTDKLTWTFDVFHMYTYQADEVNTVSVGPLVTNLATIDGRSNFGALGDWKTNDMYVASSALNWQFDPNWSASLAYRYDWLNENFPGDLVTIANNSGAYTASAFFVRRLFEFHEIQGLINGQFDTGPFSHQLVLGASDEIQHQYSDVNSLVTHPLGGGNIYVDPQPTLAAFPTSKYNPILYQLNDYSQVSLFAADTIGWNKWSLLVGLRYTDYGDTARNPVKVTGVFKANPVTPTIALSYDLAPQTRAYVSYVEGLQNGGQAGATNVNNGQTFGPIQSTQYEVGIKTDHPGWNGTLALFHTAQGADYVNTNNVFVQSGTVIYQGVEANGTVRPAPEWSLSGSFSYLAANYADETPAVNGKTVPGVPKWQTALRVGYKFPQLPGLGLDLNIRYAGKGYGNTANSLSFPAYGTGDLVASYATTIASRHVVFRLSVKNVTDQRYWVYGSSTVIPGEPRTYVAGVHLAF